MILHAAELCAVLAVCFLAGCLVGSLIYRAVGLTAAARAQAHLVHMIDRALRIIGWRLFPWSARGPVPLPRVVAVTPPDYRHATAMQLPPPAEWGDGAFVPTQPSLEAGVGRSVFDAEHLREAVDRGDAAGTRPVVLSGPRLGKADDLTIIRGLGKRQASRLAAIGIYHFSQIAAWTPQETAWIGGYLGIGDTVSEKDWVGQATRVAGSDDPEAASRPVRRPAKARARRGKPKEAVAASSALDETGVEAGAEPSGAGGIDPVEKIGDP